MGGPGGSASVFPDVKAGIDKAASVMRRNWDLGGHSIAGMARSYAPPGARNDPGGLNGGWPAGGRSYMNRLTAAAGGGLPHWSASDISGMLGGRVAGIGAAGALYDPITATGLGGGLGDNRGNHRHAGDDIVAPYGSPIFAAKNGVIASHNPRGTYQHDAATRLNWDDGTWSYYMHHALNPDLKPGMRVAGGQQLGTSGTANGLPHLHFEMHDRNNRAMSPRGYFGWDRNHLPHGGAISPNSPVHPSEEQPHVGGLRSFMGKRQWHGKKSIPDHADTQPSHHTSLHIDGRKVTESVHRHTNRSMNAASMGSRMPDYSAARPMPV